MIVVGPPGPDGAGLGVQVHAISGPLGLRRLIGLIGLVGLVGLVGHECGAPSVWWWFEGLSPWSR